MSRLRHTPLLIVIKFGIYVLATNAEQNNMSNIYFYFLPFQKLFSVYLSQLQINALTDYHAIRIL